MSCFYHLDYGFEIHNEGSRHLPSPQSVKSGLTVRVLSPQYYTGKAGRHLRVLTRDTDRLLHFVGVVVTLLDFPSILDYATFACKLPTALISIKSKSYITG